MSTYSFLFNSPKNNFFLPLTAFRIAIGFFFFASGFNKMFVPANHAMMLETITEAGIFFPSFMAVFVAFYEALFGLLLVIGFFTRLSAMILLIINVVAMFTVGINHIPGGLDFISWYSWLFYLPESAYILICLMLIVQGCGPWGVDLRIARYLGSKK